MNNKVSETCVIKTSIYRLVRHVVIFTDIWEGQGHVSGTTET